MVTPQFQAVSFSLALEKFKADLSDKEKVDFQFTTLYDLHVAIEKIQKKQASERRLKGMNRLERFLEAMTQYDKVIQVFVNSSRILAFVWVCSSLVRNVLQNIGLMSAGS